MDPQLPRLLWHVVEPVHAVTYFAPESRAAADGLGLRGFWMGYVALRVAPLGAVGPDVAAAAFYGFARSRIARALPDAWELTTPARALDARLDGVDAALRRAWGDDVVGGEVVAEAADLLVEAAAQADVAGRVLGAANAALPLPGAPHLRLWQAATTLREHRGDGHVAVLVSEGVHPVVAHLLKAAAGDALGEELRVTRQWSQESWGQGVAELQARGWFDERGALTDAGREARDELERRTDLVATRPWARLGEAGTRRAAELLRPLAGALLEGGTVPLSNPMGLRWPPPAG